MAHGKGLRGAPRVSESLPGDLWEVHSATSSTREAHLSEVSVGSLRDFLRDTESSQSLWGSCPLDFPPRASLTEPFSGVGWTSFQQGNPPCEPTPNFRGADSPPKFRGWPSKLVWNKGFRTLRPLKFVPPPLKFRVEGLLGLFSRLCVWGLGLLYRFLTLYRLFPFV